MNPEVKKVFKQQCNKNYIISLIVLIVTAFYSGIIFLANGSIVASMLILIFIIIAILYFNINNFLVNKKSLSIIKYITSTHINTFVSTERIWVKKNNYNMSVLGKSYNVEIMTNFELNDSIYCLTDKFIVFFIQHSEFVMFRKFNAPIIISVEEVKDETFADIAIINMLDIDYEESNITLKSTQFPQFLNSIKIKENSRLTDFFNELK